MVLTVSDEDASGTQSEAFGERANKWDDVSWDRVVVTSMGARNGSKRG